MYPKKDAIPSSFSTIKIFFPILILFLIGQLSCIDKIDFEDPTNTIQGALAIQGSLVQGAPFEPTKVNVSIREVFDFKSRPRLISVKEVLLVDEQDNKIALDTKQEGIYQLEIPRDELNFKVSIGKAYKIQVIRADNTIYESTYDTLLAVPQPAGIRLKVSQDTVNNFPNPPLIFNRLAFNLKTPLTASGATPKSRLLWLWDLTYKQTDSPESVFDTVGFTMASCFYLGGDYSSTAKNKSCYINFSPRVHLKVLDGTTISTDFVNPELLEIVPRFSSYLYAEGMYLNVHQRALSPQAYEYFNQVSKISVATPTVIGELIDTPGGAIASNISNVTDDSKAIYGFFYVASEKTERFYISPELANNPIPLCPRDASSSHEQGHPHCCNCLTAENSTDKKPEWWLE